MQRMRGKSKNCDCMKIRLFLENRSLEFYEILHENTLGNK